MALYKHRLGAFTADEWVFVPADAPLPDAGKIVLGKARLLVEGEGLRQSGVTLGLILEPGETLEGLAPLIASLALIVLRFPKFSDGRSYSTARRLRDQFGYSGELRAVGDVLQDQIGLLLRAGFDALEITNPAVIDALREGRIVAIRRHYQPASAEAAEAKPGWRPWLRTTPLTQSA